MNCPYCKGEMKEGVIYSDRYALKWIPKERDKGVMLSTVVKGIKLTNIETPYITVFHCDTCNKMIIDLDKKNEK